MNDLPQNLSIRARELSGARIDGEKTQSISLSDWSLVTTSFATSFATVCRHCQMRLEILAEGIESIVGWVSAELINQEGEALTQLPVPLAQKLVLCRRLLARLSLPGEISAGSVEILEVGVVVDLEMAAEGRQLRELPLQMSLHRRERPAGDASRGRALVETAFRPFARPSFLLLT